MSNAYSPAKLKVALFYDQKGDMDDIIEDALQGLDRCRMHVPTWALDVLKPLLPSIFDHLIRNNPHLSKFRPKLYRALGKCKGTTEVILALQSLDTNDEVPYSHIPKCLTSLIDSIPPHVPDVVSSKFEHLQILGGSC